MSRAYASVEAFSEKDRPVRVILVTWKRDFGFELTETEVLTENAVTRRLPKTSDEFRSLAKELPEVWGNPLRSAIKAADAKPRLPDRELELESALMALMADRDADPALSAVLRKYFPDE